MRTVFILILISFLLTACATAPQTPPLQVGEGVGVRASTLTPTATSTPVATPTITFTPTPAISPEQQKAIDELAKIALTPEQKTALEAINKSLNGVATAYADGEVFGKYSNKIDGITFILDRGVLNHDFVDAAGNAQKEDLVLKTTTDSMPAGALVNFEGSVLVEREKAGGSGKEIVMAGKTYSTEHGWGYEGDGNPDHAGNGRVVSMFQSKVDIMADGDPSVKTGKQLDKAKFQVVRKDSLNIHLENKSGAFILNEDGCGWVWGDTRVVFKWADGSVQPLPSTAYDIGELANQPLSITVRFGKDGQLKVEMVDRELVYREGKDPSMRMPKEYSDGFYGPDNPVRPTFY